MYIYIYNHTYIYKLIATITKNNSNNKNHKEEEVFNQMPLTLNFERQLLPQPLRTYLLEDFLEEP